MGIAFRFDNHPVTKQRIMSPTTLARLEAISYRVRSSQRANSLYSTPGIAIAAQLGATVLIFRDRGTQNGYQKRIVAS
jgi:hypothetical protein